MRLTVTTTSFHLRHQLICILHIDYNGLKSNTDKQKNPTCSRVTFRCTPNIHTVDPILTLHQNWVASLVVGTNITSALPTGILWNPSQKATYKMKKLLPASPPTSFDQ